MDKAPPKTLNLDYCVSCFLIFGLQKNHTHTREHGSEEVRAHGQGTHLEARDHGASSSVRRGLRGAAASTSADRADGSGAILARSGEERGALTGGGASLGLGGAAEVAGGGLAALGLVVLVEGEGELLLGRAHGVGAVLAGGGVGVDAGAGGGIHAADVVELRGDVRALHARLGLAAEGLDHAVADLGVGGRGEGAAGGPGGVDRWAGAGSGVRGGVGSHGDAAGRDLGNLGGEDLEISELGDGVVLDLDETCALLDNILG